MNLRRPTFRIDTVDRVRPCDLIRLNGKVLLVEDIVESPTGARPARRAFLVSDPNDSLAAVGEVIYLDAGDTIEQSWSWQPNVHRGAYVPPASPAMHADPEFVTAYAGAAPTAEAVDYCGDPCDPACGPDLGLPWCHYHGGTDANPYAA